MEPLPGSPPNFINQSETVRKYESASSDRLAGPTAPPNFINQSETVRNHGTTLGLRVLKLHTKPFYPSNNHMEHVNESRDGIEKRVYESKVEKSRDWDSGFGGIDSTSLCTLNHPSKDNTQSFYQSNSFEKYPDHASVNQNSGMKAQSSVHKSSQRNHNVETNFTRGTSRSETYNCPSHTTMCSRAVKHTTQSYSYSNSSKDETERIERKEKERYERRLIREHLRQKSKDQSYEYCLESFEYAGQNTPTKPMEGSPYRIGVNRSQTMTTKKMKYSWDTSKIAKPSKRR